jgi:hypothetical protein
MDTLIKRERICSESLKVRLGSYPPSTLEAAKRSIIFKVYACAGTHEGAGRVRPIIAPQPLICTGIGNGGRNHFAQRVLSDFQEALQSKWGPVQMTAVSAIYRPTSGRLP